MEPQVKLEDINELIKIFAFNIQIRINQFLKGYQTIGNTVEINKLETAENICSQYSNC